MATYRDIVTLEETIATAITTLASNDNFNLTNSTQSLVNDDTTRNTETNVLSLVNDKNESDISDIGDIINLVEKDDICTQRQEHPSKNNIDKTQEPLRKFYSDNSTLNKENILNNSSESKNDKNYPRNSTFHNLNLATHIGNESINHNKNMGKLGNSKDCIDNDYGSIRPILNTKDKISVGYGDDNSRLTSYDNYFNGMKYRTKPYDCKSNIFGMLGANSNIISESAPYLLDENSCSSYNSSDFEFITEEEAYNTHIVMNGTLKTVEITRDSDLNDSAGSSQTSAGPTHKNDDGFEKKITFMDNKYRKNHVIPKNESYFNLFQGLFSPMTSFTLENKSTRLMKFTQNEGMEFDVRVIDRGLGESVNEYEEEAEESARLILNMYPEENTEGRKQ